MVNDIFHLEFAILVSFIIGFAGILLSFWNTVAISLWPHMQSHDIYLPALHVQLLNGCSVRYRFACLVSISNLQQCGNRILGSNLLREVVTMAAESGVFVSIFLGDFRPSVRKISLCFRG